MPITSTTSPPDSGFTPRKEFIRDQQSTPNTFAILALSSSNFIRLYSFVPQIATGLQRLLEQQGIAVACREDLPHNLYEFSIDGKPWANPKAVATEKLLLDIFTLIYQAGYAFLSCIDYGREHDDRLAMAFSKPVVPSAGSRTGSPLPPGGSPFLNGSHSSLLEKLHPKRIPFALSFASTTVMRVIAPPLHLTPAILQAVRGSWPRGVVSERKVGDNCFEFKLKGYKWFQQDNFATDSLQLILSLLASLDTHSFTLLTSLSLTNRSRVKDLWIFTGPASSSNAEDTSTIVHEPSQDHSNQEHTSTESRRMQNVDAAGQHSQNVNRSQHRRLATEVVLPTQATVSQHTRSATEDISQRPYQPIPLHTSPQPHLLRKPAPRAQVPVSVVQEPDVEPEMEYHPSRANLPSTIPSEAENMTGVGAIGQSPMPDIGYPLGPFEPIPPFRSQDSPYHPFAPSAPRPLMANSPMSGHPPFSPVSQRVRTPPSSSSSPPASPRRNRGSPNSSRVESDYSDHDKVHSSPPLLSPGIFRESSVSSHSDLSRDIPIRWTGANGGLEEPNRDDGRYGVRSQSVTSPKFPGGWQATPIMEKKEEEAGFYAHPDKPKSGVITTPIHETTSRVESPEIVQPDSQVRNSEAAMIGIMAATSPSPVVPPPPPPPAQPQRDRVSSKMSDKTSRAAPNQGGQGWVLVNVESSVTPPSPADASGLPPARPVLPREGPTSPTLQSATMGNGSSPNVGQGSPAIPDQLSNSAKAIMIMDGLDAKHRKTRSASNKELAEGSSVRRFFSLKQKNSRKKLEPLPDGEGSKSVGRRGRERTLSDNSQPKGNGTTIPRSTFRDRLRLFGTPEASRREDKRRSID